MDVGRKCGSEGSNCQLVKRKLIYINEMFGFRGAYFHRIPWRPFQFIARIKMLVIA